MSQIGVARSMERTRTPRTLGEYLRWYADRWHAEMPTTIHDRGVWADRVSPHEQDNGVAAVGGSVLGSPRLHDGFRRLLDNSPFEVEYAVYDGREQIDVHYARPCRAAIARLGHSRPVTARWLIALAFSDFDWKALAERRRWTSEEAELYLTSALYLLWREFDVAPRSGG